MRKQDFLNRIFAMYPNSFNNDNSRFWANAYDDVLPDYIDYDKLYKLTMCEWSGKYAPAPAWFAERIPKCRQSTNREVLTKRIYLQPPWLNGAIYEFWVSEDMSEGEAMIKLRRQWEAKWST